MSDGKYIIIYEESNTSDVILLRVINEKDEQGIVGINVLSKNISTIVPIKYNNIEIANLPDEANNGLLFIASGKNGKKDLFAKDGELLIASLSEIEAFYSQKPVYTLHDENAKLKDATYQISSEKSLSGYLLKKNLPSSHHYIKTIMADKNSELETVYGWHNIENLDFNDTISYSIYRDLSKNSDIVTLEFFADIKKFASDTVTTTFSDAIFKEEI